MAIHEYQGVWPKIDDSCFIAESAEIIGDVTIGAGSSIWFNVTIRGDMAPITIGKNVSIQDNSVVHVDKGIPTLIGDNVTVGHGAIIHAAKVGAGSLIGMGAIVLDEAQVGAGSRIGAGALVPPRKVIPPRSQALGSPCIINRQLTEADEQEFIAHALRYAGYGREYRQAQKNL